MIRSRGVFSDSEIDMAKDLSRTLGIPEAAALLLVRQHITTPEQAKVFFDPDYSDLHDPYLMKGMKAAVSRIRKAVDAHERITIFCDYDVDGTSACAMLYLYLKSVGADVGYQLPDRNSDGYGLNPDAVNGIVAAGTALAITVDCGITNIKETRLLKQSGVDVMITDHHECGEALPEADEILNPKQSDCVYPYDQLSGAGIVFKLLQALCGREALRFVDYAALGTIADIVPLTGENRIIAKFGLKKMNADISCGIGLIRPYVLPEGKAINEYHIGFGFGPRINAAGRMETAHLAMEVLLAETQTEAAKKAAARLDALNEERKSICEQITAEAIAQINKENMLSETGAIFVIGQWEPGVIGISASRLVQKFGRPVLIFAEKGDEAVCSVRSIPEINIYEVLNAFHSYYIKFGGHRMAAGLTIRRSDFDAFKAKVNALLKKNFSESVFVPKTYYDIEAGDGFSPELASAIEKLAPFGHENPKPKLLFQRREIENKQYFGRNGKAHFKFNINENGEPISAVRFFFEPSDDVVRYADMIGTINISDFSGRPEVFIEYFQAAAFEGVGTPAEFAMAKTLERMMELEGKKAENAIFMADAAEEIKSILERSPLGTALIVEDMCEMKAIAECETIQQLIRNRKLAVRFDGEYDVPVNAVITTANPSMALMPYRLVIRLNDAGKMTQENGDRTRAYRIKEILDAYTEEKRIYAVNRPEISSAYLWFKALAEKGIEFKNEDQLYQALALKTKLRLEQAFSSVAVLCELDLIQLDKSDMIRGKLIAHNEKKDLGESRIFTVLNEGR